MLGLLLETEGTGVPSCVVGFRVKCELTAASISQTKNLFKKFPKINC